MKILLATITTVLSLQAFSQCDPAFTYTVDQSSVYFTPNDSTSKANHTWYFGDNSSLEGVYGYHSYTKPGIYYITHIIYDSVTKCLDSAKQTITLSYTPTCQSAFTYQPSLPDFSTIIFQSSSLTSGTSITQYTWKINGVIVAAGEAPYLTNHFNSPGSYQACLEINTSSGCNSSHCETINIMSVCNTKSDFLYKPSPYNARYIEFKPMPNNPDLRYKWLADQNQQFHGDYEFAEAGKHEVIMFVTDSARNCYDSVKKVIDVKGNRYDSCTASFTYIAHQQMPKQISFTPISNQPIVKQYWTIANNNGLIDSVVTSSANSVKYLFADTGVYYVTLLLETDSKCFRSFTDTVHVSNSKQNSPRETLISYPNPASNYLILPFNAEDNGTVQISIYNSMGRMVLSQKKTVTAGSNQIQISVQTLTRGQYYILLQYNNKILKSRFQKL